MLKFTLSYQGNNADEHSLDFYDAAQAMLGFQRSLALTTHLVLNGEIITQAPSLKNAQILVQPPEEGSWKIIAVIHGLVGGAIMAGGYDQHTPTGHVMYSAYDYVVSELLGFHVDYEKTLGQQYESLQRDKRNQLPIVAQSQFDSLVEKCEYAVAEMHRPIVKSGTATKGFITATSKKSEKPIHGKLDFESYQYIAHTEQTTSIEDITGRISSYNINTFRGRIFVTALGRPVPFILAESARTSHIVDKITKNLNRNALDRFNQSANSGEVWFRGVRNTSRTGRLKSFYVVDVF